VRGARDSSNCPADLFTRLFSGQMCCLTATTIGGVIDSISLPAPPGCSEPSAVTRPTDWCIDPDSGPTFDAPRAEPCCGAYHDVRPADRPGAASLANCPLRPAALRVLESPGCTTFTPAASAAAACRLMIRLVRADAGLRIRQRTCMGFDHSRNDYYAAFVIYAEWSQC